MDKEDAQFYVRAALYAYKTHEELAELEKIYNEDQSKCILNKFYQRLEFENIQKPVRIEVDEWELYYLIRKDEIIFMVPGTRKRPDAFVTDFKTDFDMDMIWTDLFGGRTQVHRGFYERYRKMRKEILKVVNEYGNTKRYCSVGHSLGAALAIFTTLELRLKKLDAWAFLLAPPKVGSESFNQLVKANIPKEMIVRVVRTNDFLPKLSPIPPYSNFGGKELIVDQLNWIWFFVALISLTLLNFNGPILSFCVTFVLTLVGAQFTHSTESYVELIDRLDDVKLKNEVTDYPSVSHPLTAAQWVPITVMVIFAYTRLWSIQFTSFIRSKYRKTVLAKLLKRVIETPTSGQSS